MTTTTKWIIGIVLAVLALAFVAPFVWHLLFPSYYGMMGGYGGYGMPMMGGWGGSFGFNPFGMIFMWLIPLGILTLIVLGIVWLVRNLTQKQ